MKMEALGEQLVEQVALRLSEGEAEEEEVSRMHAEVKKLLQMWPMSRMVVEVREDRMKLMAEENRAEQQKRKMVVGGHKAKANY